MPEGRPPWADSSRAHLSKSVSEMFSKNDRFRNEVMEELIKDCLHMEVAGIVSATFAVSLLTTFPAFVCSVCIYSGVGTEGIGMDRRRRPALHILYYYIRERPPITEGKLAK